MVEKNNHAIECFEIQIEEIERDSVLSRTLAM